MPKKLSNQKKPRPANSRKKKNVLIPFKKLIFFGFTVLSFFVFTNSVLSLYIANSSCANDGSCKSDLSLSIDNSAVGMFEGKKILPPKISQANASLPQVLGDNVAPGEKHIFVDLSTQTLTAYQGSVLVLKTLVATGKWNRTPTGNFHIWEKLVSTRMKGGEGADAYDLPNVPYVMYFHNDFGLHGAYWHDNFGHPMSHGCVNMRQIDAKALYAWADGPVGNTPGTEVSICDQITGSGQCIQNNPIQK